MTTRVTTTNELKDDAGVTIDLSMADAKLVGEATEDWAGTNVSGAGDVDGDGHDDLLVGAWGNYEEGTYAGVAYLLLGPVTGTVELSMADAKLVGEEADDGADRVSGAGDVDGDGLDDVLVGARGNDEGADSAGAAYLVLGPVTGTLDLSGADAKLIGDEASDYAGISVSGAGDVNGDGLADMLVGASDVGGGSAGAAYLVLGPVTGTFDLSLADGKLVAEGADDGADSVSGAGDMDGDGLDDVLVGAPFNDEGGSQAGAAYVVLGPVTGTLDLSLADAKLVGEEGGDQAGGVEGRGVASAGDVDGDGNDDVVVGASYNDQGGTYAGAAYLVLGPVTGTLDLSLADAKLLGGMNDHAGYGVSGAGDVDDDGRDDLLVGAYGDSEGGTFAGAAYLVLGPATGTLDLDGADAKLVGERSNDCAGVSVAGVGDVDVDGHDDLLVGTQVHHDISVGSAYLVYGGGL